MRISVLASLGNSTNILLNWLEDQGYSGAEVILEPNVSRMKMPRYRQHRLGVLETIGQIAFILTVVPFLRREAVKRQSRILEHYQLRDETNRSVHIIAVPSVNGFVLDCARAAGAKCGTEIEVVS